MPHLASDRLCTGCLACVDSCKHQAIDIIKKKLGNSCFYKPRQMCELWPL